MIDRCFYSLIGAGLALVLSTQTQRGDSPPASEPAPTNLEERYARAWLELNEAKLRRIHTANRRIANTYSQAAIDDRQRAVAAARLQLAETIESGRLDETQSCLRQADRSAARDENARTMAVAVNDRMPRAIPKIQIEILRHEHQLSEWMLRRGQAVRDEPLETRLAWQLSLLRLEVERLRDRVDERAAAGDGGRIRYIY